MRGEFNPWIGVNYIPRTGIVSEPPAYVLARLFDFDDKLVLFPSWQTPGAYVIARRRQLTAGLTDKAIEDTINQVDTKFCFAHGLVPVSLMYRLGAGWNVDKVIQSLKSRDIWEHGGAEKYADKLDEVDQKREQAIKAQTRDDMWMRSGDAWRSYQARTGASTIKFNDYRPTPRKGRRSN